jgi:Coenzyme PQQ synthesis protein D (PqqD)
MNDNGGDIFISQGEHVAARMLSGEMMIMSIRDSTLFSLNESASAIWQAADGATALRQIVERAILARFDVDRETAYRDALEMAEGLERCGILKISDQPL